MKEIKKIVAQIDDEIEGAEDYAKCYAKYKDIDKGLSDVYHQMAEAELGHVDKLHEQVVRIIKDYRAKGNEPPAEMMAIWEWEHEKEIDHVARIRAIMK